MADRLDIFRGVFGIFRAARRTGLRKPVHGRFEHVSFGRPLPLNSAHFSINA